MVHGKYASPSFILNADGNDPSVARGPFVRDGSGNLRVRSIAQVPFTLTLPNGPSLSHVPVVIYMHGLPSERSGALRHCRQPGRKRIRQVFAIDGPSPRAARAATQRRHHQPFHRRTYGTRRVRRHLLCRCWSSTSVGGVPAGARRPIRRRQSDFYGRASTTVGELGGASPTYIGNSFAQYALDMSAGERLLEEGDWSQVQAADPALSQLSFDTSNVGTTEGSYPLPFRPELGAGAGPIQV